MFNAIPKLRSGIQYGTANFLAFISNIALELKRYVARDGWSETKTGAGKLSAVASCCVLF
jgi:hypothetical protein